MSTTLKERRSSHCGSYLYFIYLFIFFSNEQRRLTSKENSRPFGRIKLNRLLPRQRQRQGSPYSHRVPSRVNMSDQTNWSTRQKTSCWRLYLVVTTRNDRASLIVTAEIAEGNKHSEEGKLQRNFLRRVNIYIYIYIVYIYIDDFIIIETSLILYFKRFILYKWLFETLHSFIEPSSHYKIMFSRRHQLE